RTKLLSDARDIHALVVVQRQPFVIYDLHAHERVFTMDEADVHDIIRLDVATSLVLGPSARQKRILNDDGHRPSSSRLGKSEVIVIHRRGAAVESLVLRITDKPQSRVRPI